MSSHAGSSGLCVLLAYPPLPWDIALMRGEQRVLSVGNKEAPLHIQGREGAAACLLDSRGCLLFMYLLLGSISCFPTCSDFTSADHSKSVAMIKHPVKETPPVRVKILASSHLEATILGSYHPWRHPSITVGKSPLAGNKSMRQLVRLHLKSGSREGGSRVLGSHSFLCISSL